VKSKKQVGKGQSRRRRKQQPLNQRQAMLRARDELLHDMRPLLIQYNLRGATDEAWTDFAAQVMHDATALYDEPEFSDLLFYPAEAFYSVLGQFNAYVPPPDELEKLSREERDDITTEAYAHAIAEFVSPEFQHAVLNALVECRRRLRREKRMDTLALASAVEMILRDDDRPLIWGICGLLFRALEASLDQARQFEEVREEALKAAQAVQPDVTDEHDFEEGSAAALAFWEVVDKTPGLDDYLEARRELDDESAEERQELDGELATQLFDPEELGEWLDALVQDLKAQGVGLLRTDTSQQDAQAVIGRLPDFLQAHLPVERFQQLLADLDELIEAEDEDDLIVRRAQALRGGIAGSDVPYWQNMAFQQFVFGALVAYMSAEVEGLSDEDDEDA
jgi:hypothetical protein